MLSFINPVKLELSDDQDYLEVRYSSSSEKPLFDICDLDGRMVKTGKISTAKLNIQVSDLINQMYVFLILDGENVRSRKFQICR